MFCPDLRLGIKIEFFGVCRERSKVLLSKGGCGSNCIIVCDAMGYIDKQKRIEIRLVTNTSKEIKKIQYVTHQKM